MDKLAKITNVDLRDVWAHEANDFTKWLAKDENISLLRDKLQIEFENVKTEGAAGRYSADIVADATDGEGKIIIENQLETTNHKHLGQLITYASALDAKHILWVVEDFNDEHKQAIDWLNKNINEDINFFLIQVEVIKIENSPHAPRFNIICEPNNWSRIIRSSASGNKLSNAKLLQMEYWEQLIEYADKNPKNLDFGEKARPQYWYNLPFGASDAHIALTVRMRPKQLGCEIYIPNNKELFDLLFDKKSKIEADIEEKLDWLRRDGERSSSIQITRNVDVTNKDSWNEFNEWFLDISNKFAKAFGSRIP